MLGGESGGARISTLSQSNAGSPSIAHQPEEDLTRKKRLIGLLEQCRRDGIRLNGKFAGRSVGCMFGR